MFTGEGANNSLTIKIMPTDFQIFTFTVGQGQDLIQWLKAKDDEGWELVVILSCASSPIWTNIQAIFKKKV